MRLFTVLLVVPLAMLVGVMLAVPSAPGVLLALTAVGVYFALVVARASDWRSIF